MGLHVNVIYAASTTTQVERSLTVEASCTVALAIRRSGLLTEFPEIDLGTARVGIFSRQVKLDTLVKDGDRIEIYRPLIIDPKQARRLRAR